MGSAWFRSNRSSYATRLHVNVKLITFTRDFVVRWSYLAHSHARPIGTPGHTGKEHAFTFPHHLVYGVLRVAERVAGGAKAHLVDDTLNKLISRMKDDGFHCGMCGQH